MEDQIALEQEVTALREKLASCDESEKLLVQGNLAVAQSKLLDILDANHKEYRKHDDKAKKLEELSHQEYGMFWGEAIGNCRIVKEPIAEGFLYQKDVAIIVAKKKTGKSLLALQICADLSSGNDLFGFLSVSRPYNVLYVQTEGDRSETEERIENMKAGIPFATNTNFFHFNVSGLGLNTTYGYEYFNREVNKPGVKFDVVIIDSLYKSVKGKLSDEEACNDWTTNMRLFLSTHNASMILMHHPTKETYAANGQEIDKGDDSFGSSFWGNFANHIFRFRNLSGTKNFVLTCDTQRSRKIIDRVELSLVEPSPLYFKHDCFKDDSASCNVEKVLRDSKEPLLGNHIYNVKNSKGLANVSQATFYTSITRLIKLGKVEKIKKGRLVYYGWVKEGCDEIL